MSTAPSQTLPDHASDPLKFSATPVSRLVEEDEEDDWNRTLRPGLDIPTSATWLGSSSSRIAHSRESSAEKIQLQLFPGGGPPVTSPSAASSSSAYSQLHTSSSRTALNIVKERIIDPKAAAYGHHRQTSIVHGIQHSRNGSLASSSSSPLSPQMIAAAGAAFAAERTDIQTALLRLDSDPSLSPAALSPLSSSNNLRSPSAMSGSTAVSAAGAGTGSMAGSSAGPAASSPLERVASANDIGSPAYPQPPRMMERMHSQRYRQEHAHNHSHNNSHSRHQKEEQKTVGEYALHVLFTSVCITPLYTLRDKN